MDDATLRKVQLTQLEMLKAFDSVCRKHHISYILSSGTLLGAVRHQGFIPWDDDLDIDMTRENYERFLACADELGDRYSVQNWHTDKEFALPFSKLRMNGTVYREKGSSRLTNCGIYIDIFPCDRRKADLSETWRFRKLNLYRLMMLHMSSAYDTSAFSMRLRAALCVLSLPYRGKNGRTRLIRKYEQLATKQPDETENVILFENGGAKAIGKWLIEKHCFEELCELPFESYRFSCPQDYDGYLRRAYGDYLQLPPEEKRYNRHEIEEISFGDSSI